MPPIFTFTTDEQFKPIVRLFIHKAGVARPRLVASFPHSVLANRFKRKLEKGRSELAEIWSEAIKQGKG